MLFFIVDLDHLLALFKFEVGFDHARSLKFHETCDLQHDLDASQAEFVVDLTAKLLFGEAESADNFSGEGFGLEEAEGVEVDL